MSEPAPQPLPRIVVVAGPTASGKTGHALAWAEAMDGEIVNADSQQVYRHMDIGTAKPSAAERARVPHHLLDIVLPDDAYNAGRYATDASAAVSAILARGRAPFVVGGTGLYLRALLEGLSAPVGRDPERRTALEALDEAARREGDPERLHRYLAKLDPASARRLHPNDTVRLIRAIEISEATGQPASELRHEGPAPRRYEALILVLDPGREALNERIDRRCEAMVERGLLQEVRDLRERGYGPELASMRAIGYRHMQPVIEGREILANVVEQMKHDTRQFARRQRTWFRAVPDAIWTHPATGAAAAREAIERFLGAAS